MDAVEEGELVEDDEDVELCVLARCCVCPRVRVRLVPHRSKLLSETLSAAVKPKKSSICAVREHIEKQPRMRMPSVQRQLLAHARLHVHAAEAMVMVLHELLVKSDSANLGDREKDWLPVVDRILDRFIGSLKSLSERHAGDKLQYRKHLDTVLGIWETKFGQSGGGHRSTQWSRAVNEWRARLRSACQPPAGSSADGGSVEARRGTSSPPLPPPPPPPPPPPKPKPPPPTPPLASSGSGALPLKAPVASSVAAMPNALAPAVPATSPAQLPSPRAALTASKLARRQSRVFDGCEFTKQLGKRLGHPPHTMALSFFLLHSYLRFGDSDDAPAESGIILADRIKDDELAILSLACLFVAGKSENTYHKLETCIDLAARLGFALTPAAEDTDHGDEASAASVASADTMAWARGAVIASELAVLHCVGFDVRLERLSERLDGMLNERLLVGIGDDVARKARDILNDRAYLFSDLCLLIAAESSAVAHVVAGVVLCAARLYKNHLPEHWCTSLDETEVRGLIVRARGPAKTPSHPLPPSSQVERVCSTLFKNHELVKRHAAEFKTRFCSTMTVRSAAYIAAVPKRAASRTESKRERTGSSATNQGEGSRDDSKGAASEKPGAPNSTAIPSFSAWSTMHSGEAARDSGDGPSAVSATSSLHIISDDPQLRTVWQDHSIPLIVPADDSATNRAISQDGTTAPKLERYFPFGFQGDIEVVTDADAPVQVTLRHADQYSATGELGEMARKARADTDTLLDALRQQRQRDPYGRARADASHHGGKAPTTGAAGGMPRPTAGSAPKHPNGAGHPILHRRPPQQSRPPPPPPPSSSHLPPPMFSSSRPPVPAYRSSVHAATAPTAQLQNARSASRPWQSAASTAATANREGPQSHGDAKPNGGDDAQPRLPKHKRLPGIIVLEAPEYREGQEAPAKRPRTGVNDEVAGPTAAPRAATKDRAPPCDSAGRAPEREDYDDDSGQNELVKLGQYVQQCGGSTAMLEGWTARVKPRPKESTGPKQSDVYFHPPAGHSKGTKQLRSMAEVARFLELKDAPAPVQKKRKQPAAQAAKSHTNDDG